MKEENYLFTSESVTQGHPDKLCDQISDALLDSFIEQDPDSRVAVESFAKTGFVIVGGEVTTKANIDIQNVVRNTICKAGYNNPDYDFDGKTCGVIISISKQSPDISQGVTPTSDKEQGAGDQGLMFGYASNETPEYMPLPIILAHKLVKQLANLRETNELDYLRPDGKSQVTVEYENGQPKRVHTVVISTQHSPDVPNDRIKRDMLEKVIKPICSDWLDENTIYHINPTGKFVIGGPVADTGLTGRKIIVDSYGGTARHGGGCFSGKDPSKVDRSAAYAARYIAKNIVAAGLADKCEVQLAYAIGVAEPVSIYLDCFGTSKIPEEIIIELIKKHFPIKPAEIIKELKLKRPIYLKTAAYGHFGREEPEFTWEKLDKVWALRKDASI